MPYDLLISENGDLVFSAIRDLQGIAGVGQVNQRIRTRLKIPLGTWTYDDDGTLGSNLYALSSANPLEAQTRAEAYVREALRPMTDINVDSVELIPETRGFTINVYYSLNDESEEYSDVDFSSLQMTIPLGG